MSQVPAEDKEKIIMPAVAEEVVVDDDELAGLDTKMFKSREQLKSDGGDKYTMTVSYLL